MKSRIIRQRRSDPLPPRWRKVVDLLQEKSMTMSQLAKALQVTPKTARTYLSEAAKHIKVKAEGPWGQTRYRIEE